MVSPAPAVPPVPPVSFWERLAKRMRALAADVHNAEPTLGVAVLPMVLLACLLFTRNVVRTNFIFDEQEAVLANPYIRSVMDAHPKYGWLAAFKLDFWGREPEVTIGSYRPLPNLLWRLLWWVTEFGREKVAALIALVTKVPPGDLGHSPWLLHWVNVLLHGLNGALVCMLAYRLLRRRDVAWLAGLFFVTSAVLTEAVSGVVGLSDVLGALGALLALCALLLPADAMAPAVFLSVSLGLFSKESALCCVPLVPLGALFLAQYTHPKNPRRWLRAGVSFVAALAALVFYVQLRKKLFVTSTPTAYLAETVADKGRATKAFAALMRWFAQPGLPNDRLNNPLAVADTAHRIGGALRVYARGLGQVVFPYWLSGDYSSPQEPIPPKLLNAEILFGGVAMVGPLLIAPVVGLVAAVRYDRLLRAAWAEVPRPDASPRAAAAGGLTPQLRTLLTARRSAAGLVAFALLWVVISYFPVSNIPIVLPTVRAERFWYFPVLGTSLVLAVVAANALEWARRREETVGLAALMVVQLFIAFQCFCARRHAGDYADDLVFWDATRSVVTRSSKAHLNYSVMLGARGRMDERIAAGTLAYQLEPTWPMASVYLGDALCRSKRAGQAIEHYKRGFDLGPNEVSLLALGLQCLWDEKMITQDNDLMRELEEASAKHPGSWYAYLVSDMRLNGDKNGGVEPKHRPRGYNEGPKEEKTAATATTSDSSSAASEPADAGEGGTNPDNREDDALDAPADAQDAAADARASSDAHDGVSSQARSTAASARRDAGATPVLAPLDAVPSGHWQKGDRQANYRDPTVGAQDASPHVGAQDASSHEDAAPE